MKKAIMALVLVLVFAAGTALGDLFSAYVPINSLEREAAKTDYGFEKKSESKLSVSDENEKTDAVSDEDIEKAAEEILSEMTLDEKIYQMMFVTPESITGMGTCIVALETTKNAIEQMPVGGIIYFTKNVQTRQQLTDMISATQSYSKIPLFIGVDEEGGTVRRLGDMAELEMTDIGDMSDIGGRKNTAEAYEAGKTIASEIKQFGFNVDFAPVADVLTNSENTVVKKRSFGSDATLVSKMALSFMYGLQDNDVSACLKHFPGHGGTAGDTHDGYSENTGTKEEILENETEAFRSGIENGCDFVMSGHISAPALTGSGVPCSLSETVIKDILKDEFGFEGVVITDALNMGAIRNNYSVANSAVMAVRAGNDMLLMPENVSEAHSAIKANVGGSISEEQIDDSVRRILKVKIKRGLIEL